MTPKGIVKYFTVRRQFSKPLDSIRREFLCIFLHGKARIQKKRLNAKRIRKFYKRRKMKLK